MPVILNTIKDALNFIDSFDGFGMIATDEDLQISKLREYDLIDNSDDDDDADDSEYSDDSEDAEKTFPQFDNSSDETRNFLRNKIKTEREKISEFINTGLIEMKQSGEEDFWSQYDDETDFQFSICDDEFNPNFGKTEIWAYRVFPDKNSDPKTDTSVCVLVNAV